MKRSIATRIPLVHALADLRASRTPGTVAMYGAIAATMLLIASVPVCGRVQDQLARAHHARPSSVPAWVVFQVVPKMYSFAHRVWVSRGSDEYLLWVNHYPIRSARFEHGRADVVESGKDAELIMRTGYQGRRWESRFILRVEDHGLVLDFKAQP